MKPFKQTESGYTATAKTLVFNNGDAYDVTKLDNPVRKLTNYAVINSNIDMYERMLTL